ncbi:hypothetical protein HSACCH_01055 [Halanaerobium saccharolyticum subsp. saccharolyticum DSM 6643]|uniref:Uncharacterized protein n=1 Tax=Halanaerobium saccharolyticum subsp. saccharolyticum DSM 6643 TaxID=1293054 RepID=M5EDH6_9FIRM|nr:hypothetical protein [Halanaerobium saccharolyticum]CCU79049.1 hypothetical protein HSACCH_01055 [Halanaerobium saccharolyticum subsp. saccharolyticum DSM 6643]
MDNKFEKFNEKLKIFSCYLIFALIILILSGFMEKFIIEFGFIRSVYLSGNNFYQSFLLSLWGIQTTISILTFTLIPFILSKLDIKVLGMNSFKFLNTVTVFKIRYWESLIYSLILILLNGWFVLEEKYLSVFLVFGFTILFVSTLTRKTFKYIIKPDKLESEIKEIIKKELKECLSEEKETLSSNIINLNQDFEENIKRGNVIKAINELNFIRKLFFISDKNASSSNKEITKVLHELLKDNVNTLIKNDYITEAKEFILESYNKFFELEEPKFKLDLYIEVQSWMEKLRYYDRVQLKKIKPIDLINYFYKNPVKRLNYGSLDKDLFSRYSYIITQNSKLNFKEKYNIFYRLLERNILINKNENMLTALEILKTLLDFEDIKMFARGINYVLNMSVSKEKESNIIILTLSIYFYYIIYKNEEIHNGFRNNLKKVVEGIEIIDFTSHFSKNVVFPKEIILNENIFKYYEKVRDLLLNQLKWEETPTINFSGEAHIMKMPFVIKEFFVFYVFTYGNVYLEKDINNNLSEDELFSILDSFFDNEGELKENIKSNYNNFLELYKTEKQQDKIKEFYQLFNKTYKEKHLNRVLDLSYNINKINNNFNVFQKEELNLLNSISYLNLSDKNVKSKSKTFSHNITVPTQSLEEEYSLKQLKGSCKDLVLQTIKKKLINIFDVILIDARTDSGLKSIITKLKELESNIDVAFESDFLLSFIFRKSNFEGEYYRLTKNIKRYENKYNYNFYINSSKFNFYLGDFNIQLLNIKEEMINKDNIDKEDGLFKIATMNDVKVYLSEEELKEYLCKMNRLIKLEYKLFISDEKNNGFIIKMN